MTDRTSYCKSCRAPIVWRRHEITGKSTPIDATPNPAGNIIALDGGLYRIADKFGADDALLKHTNHFATCVHAASHRPKRAVSR